MSKFICLFAFILTSDFAVSLTTFERSEGPSEFKSFDGSLYLVTPSLPIVTAKEYCEEQKAQLAYPRTEKETRDLATFIRENYPSIEQFIAIEALKRMEPRKFIHLPNNYDNEDEVNQSDDEIECGAINTKNENIVEIPCFVYLPALCRKKVRHDVEMCNTTDIHFEANTEKTACYKFHFKPLNWADAKEVCEKEDAHLAVLYSQEEAEHILKLHRDSVTMYLNQNGQLIDDAVLWLGFTYSYDERKPISIFGKTLEEEGYSHWSAAKGDTRESQCGTMSTYTGLLKYTKCNQTHAFACKKTIIATSATFDVMEDKSSQIKQILLANFDKKKARSKMLGAVFALSLIALCFVLIFVFVKTVISVVVHRFRRN